MKIPFLNSLLAPVGVEITAQRIVRGGFPSGPLRAQTEMIARSGISSPLVFDVGANVGNTAHQYSVHIPHATIYCFEPFPKCVAALERRFRNNPRVQVVPQAVTDTTGSRSFFANDNLPAVNSLLPRDSKSRRYFSKTATLDHEITVQTVALDDFCDKNRIPEIHILKFDIQGGELRALQGASRLLAQQSVSVIFTETFFAPHYKDNPLFRDLWNYLDGFGYSLFNLYHPVHARNGQLRFADALFVNPKMRRQVMDAFPEEA